MKFYHNLLNFFITKLVIINIFIKNINNNNIFKSTNLKKLNEEEQNVIEIELNDNLEEKYIQFINLENENIKMYINNTEEENFNNFIQIENNENYIIKLIFPDNFDGDCNNMFNNINEIKKIKFKNFNICKNMYSMFYKCSSLQSIEFSNFNTS